MKQNTVHHGAQESSLEFEASQTDEWQDAQVHSFGLFREYRHKNLPCKSFPEHCLILLIGLPSGCNLTGADRQEPLQVTGTDEGRLPDLIRDAARFGIASIQVIGVGVVNRLGTGGSQSISIQG